MINTLWTQRSLCERCIPRVYFKQVSFFKFLNYGKLAQQKVVAITAKIFAVYFIVHAWANQGPEFRGLANLPKKQTLLKLSDETL